MTDECQSNRFKEINCWRVHNPRLGHRFLEIGRSSEILALGFPTEMITVLYAIARTAGWIAHWKEMIDDTSQRIGRPRQLYAGPTERTLCVVGSSIIGFLLARCSTTVAAMVCALICPLRVRS